MARANRERVAIAALVCAGLLSLAPIPARADVTISEAVALVDADLARTPGDPALWQRRAALERRRGDHERAAADLARAGELGLSASFLQRDRALLRLDLGDAAGAEALLREARGLQPEDGTILLPHARALAALGRWRESADTYARLVALAPDATPDVHLERARALAAGLPGTADEALAALDAALARLGGVPALQQEALAIALRAGRLDEALARLDRMIAATPRPETLLVQKAETLERAGRHDEAAQAFGAALTAMQTLPPGRRGTPAAAELEQHAEAGIARIAALTTRGDER